MIINLANVAAQDDLPQSPIPIGFCLPLLVREGRPELKAGDGRQET